MTKRESRVINACFSRDAWVVCSAHRFVGGVERAASRSRWIRTTSGQLESQFLKILVLAVEKNLSLQRTDEE